MRKPAKTFEDLLVWHKAHLFVLAVYRLSIAFRFLRRVLDTVIFTKINCSCKRLVNCLEHILGAF